MTEITKKAYRKGRTSWDWSKTEDGVWKKVTSENDLGLLREATEEYSEVHAGKFISVKYLSFECLNSVTNRTAKT